ncbi:MAG: acyclic terpene utilization AtuA family protein [Parachlamydiaceae bacterium]|nr:acyclic terpene utilization AtuA family protein [Parachlamydiaceae bacterium]
MTQKDKPIVRIGNAQGFWGDRLSASASLIQQQPDLDYITLDYLAEVSLSIMAIQREKNPQEGYAKDFIETIRSLIPFWLKGSRVKIVTNAGGLNPLACAKACRDLLNSNGCETLKIGVVDGDDVISLLKKNAECHFFKNLDTQESVLILFHK